MTLEQILARLQEINDRVTEINGIEALGDEHYSEINSLNEEFESLSAKKESLEKLQNMSAASNPAPRKTNPAPVDHTGRIEVRGNRKVKNFGYDKIGNYFMDVVKRGRGGDMTEKLKNAAAVEKVGEDGGFLVPTDFLSEIQKKVDSDQSLLPMTRSFTSSSNNIELPVNETAPWDADGVNAYWEGEADQHTESKSKFKLKNFKLHKLTAYVKVSEELLEDATALESFLRMEAPEAIKHKVNSAILSGTGNGMPEGILNSGFKYQVAAEGGQPANSVVYENIVKMHARSLPMAQARGIWIINPQVTEQLRLMKFDSGAASPVPAYMPPGGLNDSPYGALMGRPVIPMLGATKALGTEGDISYVDLSYYYTVLKTAGIEQFMSTHVHFDSDLVAFKFRIRMAGGCPFVNPVTTENGNYSMSGLVTLQDR